MAVTEKGAFPMCGIILGRGMNVNENLLFDSPFGHTFDGVWRIGLTPPDTLEQITKQGTIDDENCERNKVATFSKPRRRLRPTVDGGHPEFYF
jgi:hypothetical protein